MQRHSPDFSRTWWQALIAAALCSLAGCWEEVHYTGTTAATPSGAEKPSAAAPPSGMGGDSARFGAELESSLTSRSRPEAIAQPAASSSPGFGGSELKTFPSQTTASKLTDSRYESALTFPPREPERSTAVSTGTAGQGVIPTGLSPLPDSAQATTVPTKPTLAVDQSLFTRRAAWLLGSRWSLAALVRERGAPEKEVNEWWTLGQSQAQLLGLSLKEMPQLPGPSEPTSTPSATVNYLIAEGQRLGRELTTKLGPDHAFLLELAVKSNLLLVLYEPGSPAAEALAGVIAQARERAGLPAEITQSLLAAIAERREPAVIRQSVFRMHDDVDKYFGEAAVR